MKHSRDPCLARAVPREEHVGIDSFLNGLYLGVGIVLFAVMVTLLMSAHPVDTLLPHFWNGKYIIVALNIGL